MFYVFTLYISTLITFTYSLLPFHLSGSPKNFCCTSHISNLAILVEFEVFQQTEKLHFLYFPRSFYFQNLEMERNTQFILSFYSKSWLHTHTHTLTLTLPIFNYSFPRHYFLPTWGFCCISHISKIYTWCKNPYTHYTRIIHGVYIIYWLHITALRLLCTFSNLRIRGALIHSFFKKWLDVINLAKNTD